MFRSGNRRFLYKQVDSFSNVYRSIQIAKYSDAVSQADAKVVIPPRIERGPTDILEALSATVGVKSTAFDYKYPDDPYFYPVSRFSEKIYALALESGRKSARWVFNENSKFFMKQLSEPPIEKFIPKQVEASQMETTEESLICVIEERNVPEAIRIYKALIEGSVEVSNATKQCLLELVCFFNSQEKPDSEVEEKWFFNDQNKFQKWSADFVTELFESMDSSCPLATSAMIQGMFKYNDFASGLELKEAAKVKNLKLSVGVYNAILSKLHVLFEGKNESIPSNINEILLEMSEQKVKPNLGTLNSALSTISQSTMKKKYRLAQQVMNEFVELGIEPSLGSYGCLFSCMRGSSFIHFAENILASIEHKHHKVMHLTDFKFFCSAIKTIERELKDQDLTVRLMAMFERNNNSRFINTAEDKNMFYQQFCISLFNYSPLDFAMKTYKLYAGSKFHAGILLYIIILKTVKNARAYNYLPELWKEMVQARANSQRKLTKIIMEIAEDCEDQKTLDVCHAAALTFLKDPDRFKELDGKTCSNIVLSLLKNGDHNTFKSFWSDIADLQGLIDWSPSVITEMYKYATSQNDCTVILDVLRIGNDVCHPDISEMATNALPLVDENSKCFVYQIMEDCKALKTDKKKAFKTGDQK